jgi:DNA-binding CsgD family transcriptional regulator
LIDKDGALLARNVMIPSVVAGSVAYGFSLAVYASSANVTPFLLVHKSSITLLSVISLIAGFFLFARAGESGLKSKIRAVRIFAVVYTLYYLYQLLLWVIPVPVWIFLSGFNLFLLNFIPIPLVAHLVKGHKGRNLPPGTRGKIESFYEANGLSRREREIADLIVAGKSNEEIEEELFISIFTVKKHVSNIFMKLDVKSRSQLSHSVYSAALEEHSDGGERGD